MPAMQHNPFASYHPAVAFTFLVCAAAFAMAAMQPVYVALSLAGSLACSACVRGARRTARQLPWLAATVCVVALANMLFANEGETVLFYLGPRAMRLEALWYGLCAGGMLAAVFTWMSSYAACMDSAATTALLGNVAPTISLMVSQVMRLVPQFARRGRLVEDVAAAVPAAAPRTARERVRGHLRTVSVLVGWGLDDSLGRSDAMRARGYGCGCRRTTYRRYRLGRADVTLLALIALLVAVNIPLAAIAVGQYTFYPAPPRLIVWWGYLPYAVLMILPVVLTAREWLLWRR